MKHILEAQQFDREALEALFLRADALALAGEHSKSKEGRAGGSPLRGKILAALFYEPSTRTRFSFESAMLRLGGSVMHTEHAEHFSSALKGETLEDTVRVLGSYADIIILRHHEAGASVRAAAVSSVPIVNAGDGAGQHPTQALLDLYTIQKETGAIDGTAIAMVGDLKNGRTVRSLAYLLGKYDNVSITFVSPPELRISEDIKEYLERHSVQYEEVSDLASTLPRVRVVYQTRIQKERFADPRLYEHLKGSYIIAPQTMARMRKDAVLMHPLPRIDEIAPEVDADPRAAYFRQVRHGLHIRMALLLSVLA